ncbi:unnamed protein product [Zymoseptoria tritici ST99CH_1A5]|uniref:Zn(2)-C6 fungal-type domain-containing protein n=3 Tax=Zymoseptoria tritici TaxID=1047171 RepID=A0A1X7RP09_ZYMT9|nr:unnamed protein product [Zymoseptoria tritici ST99CH_3D7]SMR48959.1 unnamed protein product [Zymoseptoria tritici ST99CH_1E4]SMY22844.1 unnamed protein product [Zymoseptoria tritici ST99CH_1A5]
MDQTMGGQPSLEISTNLDSENRTLQRRASSLSNSPRGSDQGKKIIDVACWPCRKRKGKCGGQRPSCASCTKRGLECSYEFDEGRSRVASLKVKLGEFTTRTENLEFLFEQLRSRSDEESALLLALIRLKADVDKVVAQLKKDPDVLFARNQDGSAPSDLLSHLMLT